MGGPCPAAGGVPKRSMRAAVSRKRKHADKALTRSLSTRQASENRTVDSSRGRPKLRARVPHGDRSADQQTVLPSSQKRIHLRPRFAAIAAIGEAMSHRAGQPAQRHDVPRPAEGGAGRGQIWTT
jgi:hypothetical protein